MKILLSGPVEGRIDRLCNCAEESKAHWVVSSGDFGIWPDPGRMDRASRRYHSREFAYRYVGLDPAQIKIPILTIAGVHDDNRWLSHRQSINNTEILNNIHWLAQGYRTQIGFEVDQSPCRITGFGKAYSEVTYNGNNNKRSHRHFTRRDVERACSSGPTDLLVVYEHLDSPGIRNIIYATRPKLIFTVSYPNRKNYLDIQGINVISLGRQESKIIQWFDSRFVY